MRIPGDVIRIISLYVESPLDLVRLSRCNKYFHRYLKDSSEVKKWRSYGKVKRLRKASQFGHISMVKFLTSKRCVCLNRGLYGASLGGHKSLVDLFITKGANAWNRGLFGASLGGHLQLAEFFISKGAYNWGSALYYASRGGHKLLVDLLKEKIRQRDE